MNSHTLQFDIYERFDIDTIQDTDYSITGAEDNEYQQPFDLDRLVNDMKKVVRIVRTEGTVRYIYKDLCNNGSYQVHLLTEEQAKKLFQTVQLKGLPRIKVGGVMKKQTMWTIINMSIRPFLVRRFNFFCNDPDSFNLFSGYNIQILPTEDYDESLIQHHLYHWLHIICHDSKEAYEYVLNWFANMLQNPLCRNTTVLTLIAPQGCGKNEFFCQPIQDILTKQYSYETGNANNIFGDFNHLIAMKKFVVLNEAKSVDSKSSQCINYDTFKDVITSRTLTINAKNEQQYVIDNVINLVITSNNDMPFRIQDNDRRMVFLDVSDEFAEIPDTEENRTNPEMVAKVQRRIDYFAQLNEERNHPLFTRTLFTFLMNRDISNFNPDKRPFTKKKQDVITDSRNPMELFVEENLSQLIDNDWESKYAYLAYRTFCRDSGYTCIKNIQGFIGELRKLGITTERKSIDGTRKTVLVVSEDAVEKFS